MSAGIVLKLTGISKRFGALLANDSLSLDLRRGEILALLGENGAGKSTLMSIIFGEYVADSGGIEAHGAPLPPGSPHAALAAGIGMVHQHFALADNLSVLDNVILGTEPLWAWRSRRRAARARLEELARRFGLPVNAVARVGELSVGERQRVEILKALYRDARVLILDEPTAVLTPQESEALFATLKRMAGVGLAIIFISHKLQEALAVSDRILVLRAGRLVAKRKPAETNRAELAELMVGQRVQSPQREFSTPGEPVFELRGVNVFHQSRAVLSAIDLSVRAREIVAVVGVAGNGQSVLADLASGLLAPTHGSLRLGGEAMAAINPARFVALGVGRIPEDRQRLGVVGELPLWQNAILERLRMPEFARHGWLRVGAARAYTRGLIERFAIQSRGPDTRTAALSGGNMQKLILGRVFASAPRFLVASQPTRGLDVGASAFVQERLLAARAGGAGVLLISEDLDEVLALADRVAVIYRGRLTPARPAQELTARVLGLLMAGQEADHAA